MSQSGYIDSGNIRVHVHRLRVLNAQHVSIIKEIILVVLSNIWIGHSIMPHDKFHEVYAHKVSFMRIHYYNSDVYLRQHSLSICHGNGSPAWLNNKVDWGSSTEIDDKYYNTK